MSTYTLLNGYVGSKAPYVSKIKALFDKKCTEYVEPFAGGGALYFSHPNGKYTKEWLNDADVNVANIYATLADDKLRDKAIEAILSVEKFDDEQLAREQFQQVQKRLLKSKISLKALTEEKRLQLCRDTFLVYSQSFNCSAKNYSKQKCAEKYHYETKRNLLNAVERLQTKPVVTSMDGLGVIKRVKDKPEVQIFVDWPYVGVYRNEPKLYGAEMASLKAHIEGARLLKDSKAAVVICDYRSPIGGIPTIYDAILGDDWHCFKIADTYKHCMVVKNGEAKQKAQEFVWTNRVPEHAGLYLSLVDYKEKLTEQEYWNRIRQACLDRKVPGKHILEYVTTYQEMYDADLLESDFINEVKKEMKKKSK